MAECAFVEPVSRPRLSVYDTVPHKRPTYCLQQSNAISEAVERACIVHSAHAPILQKVDLLRPPSKKTPLFTSTKQNDGGRIRTCAPEGN